MPIVPWVDDARAPATSPEGTKRAAKRARPATAAAAAAVAVRTAVSEVRVTVRAPSADGAFARQLALNDVLDALMEALPADAFALLGVTAEDLFESDEDVFTCGRAYGGSRIALVSAARYAPELDVSAGLSAELSWPFGTSARFGPAIAAARALQRAPGQEGAGGGAGARAGAAGGGGDCGSATWLARVARTCAHELGHCLGLEHCVYFACTMQGSASLAEDLLQPPFLCPVCLAKTLEAAAAAAAHRGAAPAKVKTKTKAPAPGANVAAARRRYERILAFCERPDARASPTFAAFAAWLRLRLLGLSGAGDDG